MLYRRRLCTESATEISAVLLLLLVLLVLLALLVLLVLPAAPFLQAILLCSSAEFRFDSSNFPEVLPCNGTEPLHFFASHALSSTASSRKAQAPVAPRVSSAPRVLRALCSIAPR